MAKGTWVKTSNNTVGFTEMAPDFTKEDLEAGLKILNEKPSFFGITSYGNKIEFKKHTDEQVYWKAIAPPYLPYTQWNCVEAGAVGAFSNSELEAIIKARNS